METTAWRPAVVGAGFTAFWGLFSAPGLGADVDVDSAWLAAFPIATIGIALLLPGGRGNRAWRASAMPGIVAAFGAGGTLWFVLWLSAGRPDVLGMPGSVVVLGAVAAGLVAADRLGSRKTRSEAT